MTERVGTLVIGGGFGGLGAALTLAEAGEDVLLCESLNYPGGCASTFRRRGYQFEAGATLSSGLGEGQLFNDWISRYGLDVEVEALSPVVEQRSPLGTVEVLGDRGAFVAGMVARAPQGLGEGVEAFFRRQGEVAQTLWEVLDDPSLLPPWGGIGPLLKHAKRIGRYVGLLPLMGRPLGEVMASYGVDRWPLLKLYADAVCQITVQAGSADAEALLALGTLDYFWRGTAHVRGGIGGLARGLLEAAQRAGARVWMPCEVRGLRQRPRAQGGGWLVRTRRGEVEARRVVANVLPQRLRTLLGWEPGQHRGLDKRSRQVEGGWGAAMLYCVLSPGGADGVRGGGVMGGGVNEEEAYAFAALPQTPHHLDLTQDPSAPLVEGNHLFCSISGAQEVGRVKVRGERTMTVSTHVPMATLRALADAEQSDYIHEIQEHMRRGLERLAPDWSRHVAWDMPASPRTFARFTGRPLGYVGGVPRRAGWMQYLDLWQRPPLEGLRLVGDSVFPGQSTLAAALGGVKAAQGLIAEGVIRQAGG